MGENSKIEWTDHTFNPWVGCTPVSPACDFCYAENWAKRAGEPELWKGQRRKTSSANWAQPVKWNRQAEAAGVRLKVFCASLADVFDNQVPQEWRDELWALIRVTPNLDWLLLTKRPQNIAKMLPADWGDGYPNVWLGTTVENQEEANRRIHLLLSVPAVMRFLSCEPLLGHVDLVDAHKLSVGQGKVDWVIAGGESGPKARPSHPGWFRLMRDQCADAGIPFLFKQWGEWTPGENVERRKGVVDVAHLNIDDEWWFDREDLADDGGHVDDEPDLYRVGKKAAGRLLDGVQHDGMPGAAE